ncbi:MAG: Crp/Fnr family transcriptional regulator [Candidatus Phytoplasma sp.]|nr:Crp/Fnr family transcriptional regulator [Phytoplasma sp.]
MKEFTQCIQKVPIFKNLNATEMDEVMALVKHNAYKKGDFLYAQTDQLNSLFVIHNGKVKITRYSNDGKETVIRILENGDFLGELALFSEQKANAYAEVLENSQICSINSDQIKKLLEKKPTIMFKMMNEISKRLSETEAMLEYKVTDNAETKVARLLLELTNDHLIILPTTKYNLASQIGITSETFSRKLKDLSDKNIIQVIDNKTIKIIDKETLTELLDK